MAKVLDLGEVVVLLAKKRADYAAAAERHLRDHLANQGATMAMDQLIAELTQLAQPPSAENKPDTAQARAPVPHLED